jgi:hypothetical protein
MMAALRRHDDLRHGCNLAVESSWRETGSGDQQLFRNHKAPIGTNGRGECVCHRAFEAVKYYQRLLP